MRGTSVTGTNQRRPRLDGPQRSRCLATRLYDRKQRLRTRPTPQPDRRAARAQRRAARARRHPAGREGARASMRTARRPRAARQARRANGHGNGIGHQPGPRRAGTPARDLTGPWQCERDRGRRPPVRAARRIIRPRLRTAHPHRRARPRTGRRGDGPPRQARRLDRMRRGRRRRDDLPTPHPAYTRLTNTFKTLC